MLCLTNEGRKQNAAWSNKEERMDLLLQMLTAFPPPGLQGESW